MIKRGFTLITFVALIVSVTSLFFPELFRQAADPLNASPSAMLTPITALARTARDQTRIEQDKLDGDVAWRSIVNQRATDLLPDFTEKNDLGRSVARFASEVLGSTVPPSQVFDVNGTAQDMLDDLRLNQISASTDSVYFIEDTSKQRVAVVKCFRACNRPESLFLPQISAYDAMENLQLERSAPMEFLGVGKCKVGRHHYALLAMSVSPGRMVGELLHDVTQAPKGSQKRAQLLQVAKTAVEKCAVALAELHSKPSSQQTRLSQMQVKKQQDRIEFVVDALSKMRPEVNWQDLRSRALHLIELGQKTDVTTAYCHGGINLKNFLYEVDNELVTLIDTGGLHRDLDPWNQPQGIAEVEYAQLEQKLCSMDPDSYEVAELAELCDSLRSTYFAHLNRNWSDEHYQGAVDAFHWERLREYARKHGKYRNESEAKRTQDGYAYAVAHFESAA